MIVQLPGRLVKTGGLLVLIIITFRRKCNEKIYFTDTNCNNIFWLY